MEKKQADQIKTIREEAAANNQVRLEQITLKTNKEKEEIRVKAKEAMVKERNKEIEAIIEKLGDETHDT